MSGEYAAGRRVEWAVPALTRTFASKVTIDPATRCWVWSGAMHPAGYGNVNLPGRRHRSTHQATWEHFNGPVPAGLELDHLCRNRACCNPAHLEPVTHAENVRRAAQLRTGCPQGHLWTTENTYRPKVGGRKCRECNRVRSMADRAARRAA